MRRILASEILVALHLLVGSAHAAEETLPRDHTIVKGETCAGLAARFYGDSKLVEYIHNANPSMGASPHLLVPGRVLHLPAPTPRATGPDARVGALRNRVEVQAPDPHPAKREDPLYRGNKVSTQEQSSAQVVFRDETELRLGDQTLVVILGDAKRAGSLRTNETTIVSGSARARLGELAGGTTLAGGSAKVAPGTKSEVQIAVDARHAARVGVYRGASKVSAMGKSVDVASNFGTKVVEGRAPSPPKPLPLAPLWKIKPDAVTKTETTSATLDAEYVQSQAAFFHVEVATDADLLNTLVDAKVPGSTHTLHVENLKVGDYYLRVSAYDEDGFESFYGETLHVQVVHVDPAPPPPAPPPAPEPAKPEPPPAPVASAPAPQKHTAPNVDVALRVAVAGGDSTAVMMGPSVAGHLRFALGQPGGDALSVGLRAHYTLSVGDTQSCNDLLRLDGGDVCLTRSRTETGVALPLSYLPGVAWAWKPSLTLAPGLSTTRNIERTESRERARGTNNNADVTASLGLLSPWGLFVDAGYRQSFELSTRGPTSNPSGFVGHLGWRF